nr:SAP domain-containing protein [uncultured Selenomonas sp.]
MMAQRPAFDEIRSYEEFIKYYWYRTELVEICKKIGIAHRGVKKDLNHNIAEYFKGNIVKATPEKEQMISSGAISLDTPLLACNFSFNTKFRTYFSNLTRVAPFKFTADMATAWRKVKADHDTSFTIQDMLNVYKGISTYAKYDSSACEWNRFLKDFCADPINDKFKSKLKAAAILWRIVRDSDQPKMYSHTLVQDHLKQLEKL